MVASRRGAVRPVAWTENKSKMKKDHEKVCVAIVGFLKKNKLNKTLSSLLKEANITDSKDSSVDLEAIFTRYEQFNNGLSRKRKRSDSESSSSSSSSDSSSSASTSSSSSSSSSSSDDSSSEDSVSSSEVARKRDEMLKKKALDAKSASEKWLNSSNQFSSPEAQRPAKKPRVSGEAFRRVDASVWSNEVKFGLENNSYETTFGGDGYGAKANKVLSAVKGKDFRHEKTKKKRGGYRGGSISIESNSFKYD